MEGPFQGHAPTGKKAEFYGLGVMKIYYDPGELFGGLLKGPLISDGSASASSLQSGCPFHKDE
ncbi:hypothetical protein ACHQM5_004786 [Ranunculus cassubicifolius]